MGACSLIGGGGRRTGTWPSKPAAPGSSLSTRRHRSRICCAAHKATSKATKPTATRNIAPGRNSRAAFNNGPTKMNAIEEIFATSIRIFQERRKTPFFSPAAEICGGGNRPKKSPLSSSTQVNSILDTIQVPTDAYGDQPLRCQEALLEKFTGWTLARRGAEPPNVSKRPLGEVIRPERRRQQIAQQEPRADALGPGNMDRRVGRGELADALAAAATGRAKTRPAADH
jgi:hypothetical protein